MLTQAQVAFHRPGEEHRHAIWFGRVMIIMSRKTEAEAAQWVVALGGRNAAEEQVNSEIWNSVFKGIIKPQL